MTTIKYPISVIVPLMGRRREFFKNYTLPLIRANNPAEIIVEDFEGNAPEKRNAGFQESTQPFVFFCDDDILLPADYLSTLLGVLLENPDKGYAYSGYQGIVIHKESHPMNGNFTIPGRAFNPIELRSGNYISTMSLMRREVFPGFDESLSRLQDWDLYLTMLDKGVSGIYVNKTFYAFYLDKGITMGGHEHAMQTIKQKHKL